MAQLSREGHRARMRKFYLSGDVDNIPDHNLLELYLSLIIPQKDVKPLAYDLINTFGSLENIVEAKPMELMKVNGIGESSAVALNLVGDIAKRIKRNKNNSAKKINSTEEAITFCSNILSDEIVERICFITLSNDGSIINYHLSKSGAVNMTIIDFNTISGYVRIDNAAGAIISHNHPGGDSNPSINDINFTVELKSFLRKLNVNLIDHIIVGKNESSSLRNNPEFAFLFE